MSLHLATRRSITRQLRASAQAIASGVTEEFLAHHPDWLDRYGELARTRGLEDAHFHIEFLRHASDGRDGFARALRSRRVRRYMNSDEHATSHSREPGEIMARTTVRHQAYDVLMDSRAAPEWLEPAD